MLSEAFWAQVDADPDQECSELFWNLGSPGNGWKGEFILTVIQSGALWVTADIFSIVSIIKLMV